MSIDWLDIRIDNAIEFLSLEDMMIACYDSANFSSEAACSLFARNDNNQVVDYSSGFVNVAEVDFAGLQTAIDYIAGIGRFGELTFSVNYLLTDKHLETPGSGNTRQFDGQIGESTHRVTVGVTWHNGDWSWHNQFRWLDSAVFDNSDDEFTRDIREVNDWLVVNSSVSYRFSDQLDAQLTVENLFDEDSPYAATASENGIETYYPGILGRYVRIQARYRF